MSIFDKFYTEKKDNSKEKSNGGRGEMPDRCRLFGEYLKSLRLMTGEKSAEISIQYNKSKNWLSNLECGYILYPKPCDLMTLAHHYDIHIEYMLASASYDEYGYDRHKTNSNTIIDAYNKKYMPTGNSSDNVIYSFNRMDHATDNKKLRVAVIDTLYTTVKSDSFADAILALDISRDDIYDIRYFTDERNILIFYFK